MLLKEKGGSEINKLGDLSETVDTSSQVSALDDAEMTEASLEEIL